MPFIVHIPAKYKPKWMPANGKKCDRLVSFEDLPPTLLGATGAHVPDYMYGIDLSKDNVPEREYIYVDRARQANAHWNSYAVQDKQFEYIRNMTTDPNGISVAYRNVLATVKDLNKAHADGTLATKNPGMVSWFEKRPAEEFYDLKNDPNQFHNLINDPKYKAEIDRFRKALDQWRDRGNDASLIPESEMRQSMVNGDGSQKTTLTPIVTQDAINGKLYVANSTDGASSGYSLDGGKHWELYTGALTIPAGVNKIMFKSVRYGYKESEVVTWTAKDGIKDTRTLDKSDSELLNRK